MRKKLYISLPISGRPLKEAKEEAGRLKQRFTEAGYETITPFDVNPDGSLPYSHLMGKDIEVLLECDCVCFAAGWTDSKGCNLEYAAAKIYGKQMIFPEKYQRK